MPLFALCENFVEKGGSELEVLVDVLYPFVQSGPMTIALDRQGEDKESLILVRYEEKIRSVLGQKQIWSRDLARWLKHVSYTSTSSTDYVTVPDKAYQGREIYVEVAARIAGAKNLLAWTAQDYDCQVAESRGIRVLSRQDAKAELSSRASKVYAGPVYEGPISGGVHMSSSTTNTNIGTISGSNVNIASTLTNVSQSIGALPKADQTTKDELQKLVTSLFEQLKTVPAEKKEQAEAVSAQVADVVDKAKQDNPNKSLLQIAIGGLKSAADMLKDVAPAAVSLATSIGGIIAKLHGLG
jgi:hypothetical protein